MLPYIYRQTATKDGSKTIPWGYYDSYSAVLEAGSIGELGTTLRNGPLAGVEAPDRPSRL